MLEGVEERLSANHVHMALTLEGADGEGLSWLYANAQILNRRDGADGDIELNLKIAPERLDRFKRRFPAAQPVREEENARGVA